jgi:hypothetical protein
VAYTKTTWVDGSAPAITAVQLNRLEDGVETAYDARVPVGGIIMWSGSVASVPGGWALCNGSNGTPDLRDRFVMGAGSTYAVGATGGSTSGTTSSDGAHSHTATTASAGDHSHTVTVNNHTLTVAQLPSHNHRPGDALAGINSSTGGNRTFPTGPFAEQQLSATGSGLGHNHTASSGTAGAHTHTLTTASNGAHTHTVTTLNPYYALAFIMKL